MKAAINVHLATDISLCACSSQGILFLRQTPAGVIIKNSVGTTSGKRRQLYHQRHPHCVIKKARDSIEKVVKSAAKWKERKKKEKEMFEKINEVAHCCHVDAIIFDSLRAAERGNRNRYTVAMTTQESVYWVLPSVVIT
jgi:hypothetical protein